MHAAAQAEQLFIRKRPFSPEGICFPPALLNKLAECNHELKRVVFSRGSLEK
jgi:hypothetical protein